MNIQVHTLQYDHQDGLSQRPCRADRRPERKSRLPARRRVQDDAGNLSRESRQGVGDGVQNVGGSQKRRFEIVERGERDRPSSAPWRRGFLRSVRGR